MGRSALDHWGRPLRRAAPRTRKLIAINSNAGWHAYYVQRFNLTQHPDAEHLAMFYLLLALRDGEIADDVQSSQLLAA